MEDLVFANVVLGAYKFSSKTIAVSLEMLQDTAFDIETLIFDCFAERIGRIVGRRVVTGNGTSQPQGIATAAGAGVTLTASSSSITYANVLALYGSTDPAYDMMAEWAFNKATKVKPDGRFGRRSTSAFPLRHDARRAGRRVWQRRDGRRHGVHDHSGDGEPGRRQQRSCCGAISRKHKIRQAMAMEMYRQNETHIASGQIGFVAFARYDSKFVDGGGGAVKAMAQAS